MLENTVDGDSCALSKIGIIILSLDGIKGKESFGSLIFTTKQEIIFLEYLHF
jgi:hypothetical protein